MIDKISALSADIDMTLTKKGGTLPSLTVKAFQILHKNGVKLGLATGREIDDILLHQGEKWNLGFEFDFIIGMNGGMLYDHSKDSLWKMNLMNSDHIKEIMEWMKPLIEKYKFAVNAEGGNNKNAMYIQGDLLTFEKRHGYALTDKTGDYEGFSAEPTYKLLFRAKPEQEKEVRDRFLEKFSDTDQIVSTYPGTVEVMEKGISKGTCLQRYCNQENIDINKVIAFGDSENDEEMLKVSGWGVCLKNGADGTKAIADDITEYDCLDAGVGHYLFDHYIDKNISV